MVTSVVSTLILWNTLGRLLVLVDSAWILLKSKSFRTGPSPRNLKMFQSFLGFANFYRHFIHGYSEIVLPLTCLTRKATLWNFDDDCCLAFQTLKVAFITALVLTHWKPGHSLIVETDASDYTLAGILSMQDDNSEIRPIAFLSWTFSRAKLNYDVHDKELLAIYEAFRSWHHYLEGASSQIDVVTDHVKSRVLCDYKITLLTTSLLVRIPLNL